MSVDPTKFLREVRSEISKVTWPTRKETLVTTGVVIAMVIAIAVFFLAVDEVIALVMSALFGFNG